MHTISMWSLTASWVPLRTRRSQRLKTWRIRYVDWDCHVTLWILSVDCVFVGQITRSVVSCSGGRNHLRLHDDDHIATMGISEHTTWEIYVWSNYNPITPVVAFIYPSNLVLGYGIELKCSIQCSIILFKVISMIKSSNIFFKLTVPEAQLE